MFSHIFGNDKIKEYLVRMIRKDAIGNSLLFAGPDGIGKSLFAEAFAKALLSGNNPGKFDSGNHPDLHVYSPEGKIGMHSIQSMRQLKDEVYLPPYESDRKVFIIHDADRMLGYSANALLKTFEEPSLDTIIILLTDSPELLLPTIMSRCRATYFQRLTEEEIVAALKSKKQISDEEAKRIAALAGGSVGNALRLLESGEHPAREIILKVLAAEKFSGYAELAEKAKEIAAIADSAVKVTEEAAKADLLKGFTEKLNASQMSSIEKEVDGIASMQLAHEAHAVFDVILAWVRDIHLLLAKGNPELLFLRDQMAELQKAATRKHVITIEEAMQAVKGAKLSLERSTPFHMCLENLFLKLNLI